MKTELQTFCAQWGAAALNGMYQGIIVAILVGLVLRMLLRTNAATRHAVWFGSLVVLVLIIPAHYWLDQRFEHQESPSESAAQGLASISPPEFLLPESSEPGVVPFEFSLPGSPEG